MLDFISFSAVKTKENTLFTNKTYLYSDSVVSPPIVLISKINRDIMKVHKARF